MSLGYEDLQNYSFCKRCDQLIPPSQVVVDSDDWEVCPDCGESLWGGELAVDDNDDFTCDVCQYPIYFGDEQCAQCYRVYSLAYWETLCDTTASKMIREIEAVSAEEAYFITLCCNKDYEDCDCVVPVDWQDGQNIPKAVLEDAYDYNADCSSCVFYYTPQCIPYRSWLVDFLETGTIPGGIDTCTYHKPHEACMSDDEAKLTYFAELGGYLPVRKRA